MGKQTSAAPQARNFEVFNEQGKDYFQTRSQLYSRDLEQGVIASDRFESELSKYVTDTRNGAQAQIRSEYETVTPHSRDDRYVVLDPCPVFPLTGAESNNPKPRCKWSGLCPDSGTVTP